MLSSFRAGFGASCTTAPQWTFNNSVPWTDLVPVYLVAIMDTGTNLDPGSARQVQPQPSAREPSAGMSVHQPNKGHRTEALEG